MDGLLVIDKPVGPTSHDAVATMRRVFGERRIGHTGTLDPAASGVLPLVIGRATRLARFLSASDKRYEAVVRLGVATDTHDALGEPTAVTGPDRLPTPDLIARALEEFRGTFLQRPPLYSAKKIAGRRSYEIARAVTALAVDAPPAPPAVAPAAVSVTVHSLEIVGIGDNRVTLTLDCSAGFYVRSLAHELGERLGIGAHLAALRRTASAGFTLADALPLQDAVRDPSRARGEVISIDRLLSGLPSAVLTDEGRRRVAQGRDVGPADLDEAFGVVFGAEGDGASGTPATIRLVDRQGQLVGIGEPAGTSGLLHPSVVLV